MKIDGRASFSIPDDITYLNCAFMSPVLKTVADSGQLGFEKRTRPWDVKPADFFSDSDKIRELAAQLIHTTGDHIAIVPAVSYGMAIAAQNVTIPAGSQIVVVEEEFPSNVYAWREAARTRGAKLVTVPRPVDGDWTAAILYHLGPQTRVASLPNCHWADGSFIDLEIIGAKLRQLGAALVVDASQSLGALPFDVQRVKPDFVVSVGYKWLLGPYGVALFYSDSRYHSGTPLEHNWLNRDKSEDFTRLVEYQDQFQPGARRFDMGQRSNFLLLPMMVSALTQILDTNVSVIQEQIGQMTDEISGEAKKLGISSLARPQRAGHMLGLRVGIDRAQSITRELAAKKIFVSARGGSIRISPHLYNDVNDISRLIDGLTGATR